jgi:hypothetical protein
MSSWGIVFRGRLKYFEGRKIFPRFYVRDDIMLHGKLEMDSSNGRPFER